MSSQQSDFIPSNIPQSVVQQAFALYYSGDYAGAWTVLAKAGDAYAADAAMVLNGIDPTTGNSD